MKVRIEPHTVARAAERGVSETEILEVVQEGQPLSAKHGRIGKVKVFDFKRERAGRYYEQKRVEVYYVMEGEVAVTVTVYAFYGKWEA